MLHLLSLTNSQSIIKSPVLRSSIMKTISVHLNCSTSSKIKLSIFGILFLANNGVGFKPMVVPTFCLQYLSENWNILSFRNIFKVSVRIMLELLGLLYKKNILAVR